jgi:hypothetical protein
MPLDCFRDCRKRSQPVHVFDDRSVTLFFELQRVTLFLFRVSVRVPKSVSATAQGSLLIIAVVSVARSCPIG